MGFSGTFKDSLSAAGAGGTDLLSATQAVSSDEEIELDVDLADSLTDHAINLGIPATAKLKGLMLANVGAGDITSIKVDSGTLTLALKSGSALSLGEASLAKKVVDMLSGATTLNVLKVSTGPAATRLRGIILVDSA